MGSHSQLKVDYALLDSTERSLSSLLSEFENIQTQESAYDGAMGSGDVVSAMHEFSGNWDDHRKNLISSMQALGKMVHETKAQFQKTDDDLCKALTKQ